MKTKRVLIGTVVAAICLFLCGAVIYGMLLGGFMAANTNQESARPQEEMLMGAISLSNVISGLLIALLLDWTASFSFGLGARRAAIVGLLIAVSYDLAMHAMTTLYSNVAVIVVDSIAYAVMFAVAGGVAGWAMGKWGGAPKVA